MTPRVYLAAGWFNPKQKKQMDEIHTVLKMFSDAGHLTYFSPFYNGIVLRKDDPDLKDKMKKVWDLDIKEVQNADLIVASTQDHDVGTIYECGYARGYMDGYNKVKNRLLCTKTVFCYNSNPELGLNVMLAQEARAFCKTEGQLVDALRKYLDCPVEKRSSFCFNVWEGEPI